MTARELYEYILIEINKVEAPTLLIEDFNYLINKAVQQYMNLTYNRYDINQQSTDDLRVLKATTILQPKRLVDATDLLPIKNTLNDGILSSSYYVDLPKDYVHILNCIIEYEVKEKNKNCKQVGTTVHYTAKRLTSDMYGQIINNYYLKPTFKRPYYYINNINTNNAIVTNQEIDNGILDYEIDPNEGSLKDKYAVEGDRLANVSNVRLELRFGDSSIYEPCNVYVDYLKAPMHIRLDQEQISSILDYSQILEFPDYVCYEIVNIVTRLVMENASDPRMQTNIPLNQTIPDPMSPQGRK